MPWRRPAEPIDWTAADESPTDLGRWPKRLLLTACGATMAAFAAFAASALERSFLQPEPLDACRVVSAADLEAATSIRAEPTPFEPEGGTGTGCNFLGAGGTSATVFAVSPGGRALVRGQRQLAEEHSVLLEDLNGPGYIGYLSGGPRGSESASVVVLQGDRYVNVVLHGAADGSAERVARLAAQALSD